MTADCPQDSSLWHILVSAARNVHIQMEKSQAECTYQCNVSSSSVSDHSIQRYGVSGSLWIDFLVEKVLCQ